MIDSPHTLAPDATALAVTPSPRAPLAFEPVAMRARADGWTPERQRQFVEQLADCGIVREAAARVGMSEQSVSRLRRRTGSASFVAACESALQIGTHRLRSIAFDRAVNGYTKRHYYHGELRAEEHVYDHRLLIFLLGKTGLLGDPGSKIARFEAEWEGRIEALDDSATNVGAHVPAADQDEVWDEGAKTWTRFPPPIGFRGTEHGRFGDDRYRRTLSPAERAALVALRDEGIGLALARAAARRDRYFGLAGGVAEPLALAAPDAAEFAPLTASASD